MAVRLVTGVLAAATFAVVALIGTPRPVAAECTSGFDRWPPFRELAPSATRIVVGTVVAAYDYDSADNAIRFRFGVDEVLRGASPSVIEFRTPIPAADAHICPGDSLLRVGIRDVIALAYDSRTAGRSERVSAAAFISRPRAPWCMPGIERLSLAEVRRLAALPRTDTETSPASSETPLAALAIAGAAGAIAGVITARRRRNPPSPPRRADSARSRRRSRPFD